MTVLLPYALWLTAPWLRCNGAPWQFRAAQGFGTRPRTPDSRAHGAPRLCKMQNLAPNVANAGLLRLGMVSAPRKRRKRVNGLESAKNAICHNSALPGHAQWWIHAPRDQCLYAHTEMVTACDTASTAVRGLQPPSSTLDASSGASTQSIRSATCYSAVGFQYVMMSRVPAALMHV